jgi:hypothetical protein
VADEMVLNGKPCRVFRFEVEGTEQGVLDFYRERFRTTRAIETRVKNRPVIATRQGDYFHTVQVNVADGRSVQATVITTALRAEPVRHAVALDTEALMPPDTAVVSTMQSSDAGRHAVTVVAVNRNSVQANHDHLVSGLRQRGFHITDAEAGHAPPAGAVSLSLASSTEQAMLTISDAGAYRAVLLHRTREQK